MVHAVWVVKSRAKRVRSGTWGNNAKESRVSQREKARVPPPLMAYSRASVTTALGYSLASGCCGPIQPLLVHRVEQGDNEIWGRHTLGSSWLKFAQPQLEPVCGYLSTRTLAVTYQTNTIGYYATLEMAWVAEVRKMVREAKELGGKFLMLQPTTL